MARLFEYLLIPIVLAALASANDYCRPQTCGGQTHTMCLFRSPQPASACGRVYTTQMTRKEQDDVLQMHNKLRAKVASGQEYRGVGGAQPRGKIVSLQWDPELAQVAQRWANQCQFGHDACRDTPTVRIGQNVAYRAHSAQYDNDLVAMVQSWYDEVKDFNSHHVSRFVWQSMPQIGHYTQLVWGKTTHVGCGVTKYYENNWYTTYMVCNYGPGGNMIDSPVYERI